MQISVQKKIKNASQFKKAVERFSAEKITQFLETILAGAVNLRASDIHFDPEKESVKIRIRLDGILREVTAIKHQTYQSLLSRIKLLSGIKLNITDRPQDGRFSIIYENLPIEIRTSSLPAEYEETIVLRILNPQSLISIEGLGLRKDLLAVFKKEIRKPNGMIIVSGPTGSGKTTTLYAFLKKIQKPEVKIITIEDPIEYHLEGIAQTRVQPKKGYDFASGLKSIVRQDPDIILVGEIRDAETAKIALQASLTGHLVLTTLHTNDAAGTIARLTNFEANLTDIGPAINLAIAQRLIRKICRKCGKLVRVSANDLKKLKKELRGLPKAVKTPRLTPGLKIPQIKGCQSCNFTGYQGRIGIFEALVIDDEMEKSILKRLSVSDLRKKARKKGMVLMKQDGLIKVLEGTTTIEEVERVTGE